MLPPVRLMYCAPVRAVRADQNATGPPNSSSAATGRRMAASIISSPCRVSVTLTAQKPPSRVYSRMIAPPRAMLLPLVISKVAAKVLPAPWNWEAM